MAGRLRTGWNTLPALYKKRVYQGVGAYVAVMLALGGWVALGHNSASLARDARIPQVESDISALAPAPQLADLSNPSFNLADIHSASEPSRIALIMTDLGLSQQADERAITALPAGVTLAFSPYGKYGKTSAVAARKDGHKVLALIPMEPNDYPRQDPGPLALSGRNPPDQNQRLLNRVFAALPQVDGAMNFMGSRFLGDEQNADLVIKTLQARKIPFVELQSETTSAVATAARTRMADFLHVDIDIDSSASESDIRAQLGALERLSRQNGLAIGIIRPLPLTFALVDSWIDSLQANNITLVDVSEAVKTQAEAARKPAATQDTPPAPPAQPVSVTDPADATPPADLAP